MRTGWTGGIADGTWQRGKARSYTKVPVTQADKDRVLAQVREQGKQFGMPQDLRIDYPFAETKPPFDFALGRPNGEVWLQRPRARKMPRWCTTSSIGRASGGGRSRFR